MNTPTRRLILIVIAVALGTALGYWYTHRHPTVKIEDGKTIDFSSGKPVVKDSAEDRKAIDAAVKEMDEASKGITFGPSSSTKPAVRTDRENAEERKH